MQKNFSINLIHAQILADSKPFNLGKIKQSVFNFIFYFIFFILDVVLFLIACFCFCSVLDSHQFQQSVAVLGAVLLGKRKTDKHLFDDPATQLGLVTTIFR